MTKMALVLALAGTTLAGCASYQPSQAECFTFTAAAAGESPCTFELLMDEAVTDVSDD